MFTRSKVGHVLLFAAGMVCLWHSALSRPQQDNTERRRTEFPGLPDVCHPAGSDRFPRVGDSDFFCSYDGCNGCIGCSCTEEGLTAGACTRRGCGGFYSDCAEAEAAGKNVTEAFQCYDGCNFCSRCTCDGEGRMRALQDGQCTDRTCHP